MAELTSVQKERIEYLATDAWVVDTGAADDVAISTANFQQALDQMSSIELHHFACNFNWDCGTDELERVIEHPQCDAGTAMMIFWLGQPAYFYRRNQMRKLTEHEQSTFELLCRIEKKLLSFGFTHSEIACDPSNIMGQAMTKGSERDRELLDARLFNRLDGEVIVPYLC